jgi:hypothetical protein
MQPSCQLQSIERQLGGAPENQRVIKSDLESDDTTDASATSRGRFRGAAGPLPPVFGLIDRLFSRLPGPIKGPEKFGGPRASGGGVRGDRGKELAVGLECARCKLRALAALKLDPRNQVVLGASRTRHRRRLRRRRGHRRRRRRRRETRVRA